MVTNAFDNQGAPGGLELPAAARNLINTASAAGWVTGWVWESDKGGSPFVTVHVMSDATGEYFKYTWHSRGTGTLRLFSRLHRQAAGHLWREAPSIKVALAGIAATEER